MARLGDICTLVNGYAFKPTDWKTEGLPIIRIQNLNDTTAPFNYFEGEIDNKYVVNDGDLLFSWSGTPGTSFGAFFWRRGKGVLNQHIFNVYPVEGVTKEYLRYALNGNIGRIIDKAHGGVGLQHITKKELVEIDIPILSEDQQKQIVTVLDSVDKLIALRNEQLVKLDQLVKSRFIELFGMPGTDTNGWGLIPLGEACQVNPKKGQDKRMVSGLTVSFVPMPAVSEKGEIDPSETREYDTVKTGFTYFAENDVLFAKITPCMENGKGAVARGLYNGIGFGSTEFHVLRPISGKTNPYWLYMLTAFSQFREDAANNMTGSAGQRRVPASFLENYRVSVPPMGLQEQFAAFVEQTDKSKFDLKQSLEKLETLKISLMQQYFG